MMKQAYDLHTVCTAILKKKKSLSTTRQ